MKKRQLLHLPKLFPSTLVFFFYRGGVDSTSYSIRDYSAAGGVKIRSAKEFPGMKAGDIMRMAEKRKDAPAHDVDDIPFWSGHISKANQRVGLPPIDGAAPAAGTGATSGKEENIEGSYHRIMSSAPRRHAAGNEYFQASHNGVTSSKSYTNQGERHLEVALFNRFGEGKAPIRLPDGRALTILDYQFPLKARRDDNGVGKVDLLGVDDKGRAWVIELKMGNNQDSPADALHQALGYAAMVQANMDDIRTEPKGQAIREAVPAVCVMAPEEYWLRAHGNGAAEAERVRDELGMEAHLVSISMEPNALTYGLNGAPPTLSGEVGFEYVEGRA